METPFYNGYRIGKWHESGIIVHVRFDVKISFIRVGDWPQTPDLMI